ncbi:hypothetical protein HanHA300_Chr15g0559191 [Helianthus annuus]|nr:hypothetical protein HanHA300_Chr15g0559191 [Helianthus annuus]KAJ0454939.1 hypothetical protein HanIR_Chr15g0745621 [Helianthus annuus]
MTSPNFVHRLSKTAREVESLKQYTLHLLQLQVNYALGALRYLYNASAKEDLLRPNLVDNTKSYVTAGSACVS